MDKIIIKKKGKNQMKNITKLLPIALIGLFMVSCQNDDEQSLKQVERNQTTTSRFITEKVDDLSQATIPQGYLRSTMQGDLYLMLHKGINQGGNTFVITIKDNKIVMKIYNAPIPKDKSLLTTKDNSELMEKITEQALNGYTVNVYYNKETNEYINWITRQ
jgi:hypothetical protein